MLNGIVGSLDMNFSKLWEMVKDRDKDRNCRHAAVHGVMESWTQMSD